MLICRNSIKWGLPPFKNVLYKKYCLCFPAFIFVYSCRNSIKWGLPPCKIFLYYVFFCVSPLLFPKSCCINKKTFLNKKMFFFQSSIFNTYACFSARTTIGYDLYIHTHLLFKFLIFLIWSLSNPKYS